MCDLQFEKCQKVSGVRDLGGGSRIDLDLGGAVNKKRKKKVCDLQFENIKLAEGKGNRQDLRGGVVWMVQSIAPPIVQ